MRSRRDGLGGLGNYVERLVNRCRTSIIVFIVFFVPAIYRYNKPSFL
jgi:hypothetical protein